MKVLSVQLEGQTKVILAELQSESSLVRNWRAIVALSFAFSILFFGLIEPVMVAWLGVRVVKPDVKVLEWHYQLTTICLSAFVGGSIVEKLADIIVSRKKP